MGISNSRKLCCCSGAESSKHILGLYSGNLQNYFGLNLIKGIMRQFKIIKGVLLCFAIIACSQLVLAQIHRNGHVLDSRDQSILAFVNIGIKAEKV